MTWLTLKRIFRAGFLDFWRNGFVSFASILSMVFTLSIIGVAIFTGVILNTTIEQFQDKADMSVYFTLDAPVDDMLALQKSVNALPEVASTQYVSREDELIAFRARHQNDQLTLQALDELGSNPLPAVLMIQAKDITQYGNITTFLKNQATLETGKPQIIDRIISNRDAIDKLTEVTVSAQWIGLVLILIFVINTVVNSFNTLRLAIYTSREEIGVMRLVGAGQAYIRLPFIVEGVMYGFIAGIVTMLLFYPLTYWLGHATEDFFGGINVFSYYLTHFPLLFLIIVGSGVLLGAVASYLATRRYLKI